MAAPLLLDLLWPIFLITGLESVRIDPGNTRVTPLDLHDYPYSHSLLMAVVWSVVAAVVYWKAARYPRGALVIGAGVFSHWILDWITHRPDMPLYPGSSTRVGLGLWNSVVGTVLVEGTMFVAAVFLYARTTRPRTRAGSVGLWLFASVLALLYAESLFGPPPPSVTALKYAALGAWLFVLWAASMDRAREVVAS